MSNANDNASAFGCADEPADASPIGTARASPSLKRSPTLRAPPAALPPTAPAEMQRQASELSPSSSAAHRSSGRGDDDRYGEMEDRSPPPRQPRLTLTPAAAAAGGTPTTSGSASQPTLWEEHDIELEATPPSSTTTWHSPVQVLPNTITPQKPHAASTAAPTDAQVGDPTVVTQSILWTAGEGKEGEESPLQRAATAPCPISLSVMMSEERRSVTVTHHPLDGSGFVEGSSHGGRAGSAAAAATTRLFSPDFDSPSRAAEEMKEWVKGETLSGVVSANLLGLVAASALLPRVTSTHPSATSSEGGESYGVVSAAAAVTASTTPPPGGEGRVAQPTPYPVTSTSSLADWSSAPRLGFAAPVSPTAASAEATSSVRRDAEEHKREDKWYRLCRGVSLLASATPDAIVRLRSVAREHGIPHHLRAVMWLTLTGMALKVDENEYFCAKLLRRNGYVTGPNADAIAADVQRTFPGHPYFSEKDVGIYKLTNVLHALCWRNPLLSYCQSFNFLAAFLLLVLDDEERVFWLLVHIFEQLLPNDFYGETLLGANVEQAVLERLVKLRLPRVAARFTAAGLQVHTLVANWMMSMFVNIFPPATALRMWDYLFCQTTNPGERTPAHLEITLAVLKYLEERNLLAGEDAGELLMALREHTASLYDAAAIIRIANTFAITPDELHQLRREAKPAVIQHLKSREVARAAEHERRVAQELRTARGAASPAPTK